MQSSMVRSLVVALGACCFATWLSMHNEVAVNSRGSQGIRGSQGLLLDCGMKPADGFHIVVSGSSERMRMVSGSNGSFEVPSSLQVVEDIVVEGFTGIVMLGHPFNANWTSGHCESPFGWEQIAFCPGRTMMGHEVQANFLDTYYEALVACPDGALVEAPLIIQSQGAWRFCTSLCPKQTCLKLTTLSNLQDIDECLRKNVEKNFPDVMKAASADVGLLEVLHGICARTFSDSPDVDPKVQQNLHRLVKQYDPWRGQGPGKHILLDVSGSMGDVMQGVRRKLGTEFKNVQLMEANDSMFTRNGSMGGRLLGLLTSSAEGSMPEGSMLVVVSDFQDGVEDSFCAEMRRQALAKHAMIVLESVEKFPHPCLHEVAEQTGGHSSVGRIMRK